MNILQINQAITQPDVNSIIWVANNLTSDDDRQSAYVEELKAGNETTNNAEFVIATIEELKFVIEDKLVQKEPEKEPEKESKKPHISTPLLNSIIDKVFNPED